MRASPMLLSLALLGCGASGSEWVKELDRSSDFSTQGRPEPAPASGRRPPSRTIVIGEPAQREDPSAAAASEDPAERGAPAAVVSGGRGGPFRNTYYDFPAEAAASVEATLFDASCKPIAQVSQAFHDAVCVQGSGRLASGGTVSFARRDCPCAAVCPRTDQRICFERLDAARFPWGRGATGKPITPLSTVAVDTAVIPLGSALFIPEAVGMPRPDGSPHDGCFVAEDRGKRVVGMHVDLFTGDPAVTALWNSRLPSNRGVHVLVGDARCRP